jgi:hypothetical protein
MPCGASCGADHPCLAGSVHNLARVSASTNDGCHVYNAAGLPSHHQARGKLHDLYHGEKIGLHHFVYPRGADHTDQRVLQDTCVVHEEIQLLCICLNLSECRFKGVFIGDIANDEFRFCTSDRLDFPRRILEPLERAGSQDQAGPLSRSLDGCGSPDAA